MKKTMVPSPAKAVELGIFRVPAVQALIAYFVAFGTINYSMMQWAPIYFVEKLRCSTAEAAAWLTIVNSINVPGTFVSGAIESVLLRAGTPQLAIRRWMQLIAVCVCHSRACQHHLTEKIGSSVTAILAVCLD